MLMQPCVRCIGADETRDPDALDVEGSDRHDGARIENHGAKTNVKNNNKPNI